MVVGPSETNSKTVTADSSYKCPSVVNKDNWLPKVDTHNDTFSVDQNETDILVTRTDSTTGWEMLLQFHCCGKVSYMKIHQRFIIS